MVTELVTLFHQVTLQKVQVARENNVYFIGNMVNIDYIRNT